jgi:hypothetical protein
MSSSNKGFPMVTMGTQCGVGSSLTLKDCELNGVTNSNKMKGIVFEGNGKCVIERSNFTYLNYGLHGGAVASRSNAFEIKDSTFKNCGTNSISMNSFHSGSIDIFGVKFLETNDIVTPFIDILNAAFDCDITLSCFQSVSTTKYSVNSVGIVRLGNLNCFSQTKDEAILVSAPENLILDVTTNSFECTNCFERRRIRVSCVRISHPAV